MNNEKKETTTFKKILKGFGVIVLVALSGLAIYDHRKEIGTACKSISKKFTKKNVAVNPEVNSATKQVNNPRRNNVNIRKN